MATAVEQQVVERGVARRAAEHRRSIHARAARASRCINTCAVPRARQFARRRPLAAAPRSIREPWSGRFIASTRGVGFSGKRHNPSLQPTALPPLRVVRSAAELSRWATVGERI